MMCVCSSLLGYLLRANINHRDRTNGVLNMVLLSFSSQDVGSDNVLRASAWQCSAPSQQNSVVLWWTLSEVNVPQTGAHHRRMVFKLHKGGVMHPFGEFKTISTATGGGWGFLVFVMRKRRLISVQIFVLSLFRSMSYWEMLGTLIGALTKWKWMNS